MKKLFTFALLILFANIASYAIPAISGPTSICIGNTADYYDSTGLSYTWSSSDPLVASIDATGTCYALSVGVTTISYTSGGAVATLTLTVNPLPAPISGPSNVCLGSTITLTDATPGGVWST